MFLAVLVIVLFIQKMFLQKTKPILAHFDNKNSTPKFINFNTTWCYWSKELTPTWNELIKEMSNKDIEIIDLKCDLEDNSELCKRYEIYGYPTIKLMHGNKIVDYNGDRSLEDMKKFIESNLNY